MNKRCEACKRLTQRVEGKSIPQFLYSNTLKWKYFGKFISIQEDNKRIKSRISILPPEGKIKPFYIREICNRLSSKMIFNLIGTILRSRSEIEICIEINLGLGVFLQHYNGISRHFLIFITQRFENIY